MEGEEQIFHFNPLDIEAVRNAILNNPIDDEKYLDDSDEGEEEHISEREGDSESEQSFDSSDEDNEESSHASEVYRAVEKKDNEVVNTWNWRKTPLSRRKRANHNILLHLPGVKGPAKNVTDILGVWNCLFSTSMIERIVENTNRYVTSIKDNYSRPRDAKETDLREIKAFIGLLYLAGVYHANRLNLQDLWRMDDFKLVMNQKRFQFLMRCLRLDNIDITKELKQTDRLAPVREIFEEFVANCQKCYSPGENLTIDEKLEAFRGKCGFVQYMPKKPSRYGIKIYTMVDAKVFYTYNMEIYAGAQPAGPFSLNNKPSDVVLRLASPIFNTGRNVTCDNWFSKFELVDELAKRKLSFVGPIKKNEPQIPPEFKVIKKSESQTKTRFGFRKEATLVSYNAKPRKNLILISSLHDDDAIDSESGSNKVPEIITFYNSTKGGVDTVDKMCNSYNVARNTGRWPLVIFYAILNVAAINAQIIFTANSHSSMKRGEFLRKLSTALVEGNIQQRTQVSGELREKILKRTHLDPQETGKSGSKRCKPCLVEKRRRNTRYSCEFCHKNICLQHSKNICIECADCAHV